MLYATLAAAIAVVVGWNVLRGPGGTADGPSGAERTFTPLTGSGRALASALSPDGTLLAYTERSGADMTLRQKQIGTGSESVLVPAGPHGLGSPVYSRDGQFVYFTRRDQGPAPSVWSAADLARVSVLGGAPSRVATDVVGWRFDCSPEGDRVALLRLRGRHLDLVLANGDGSGEEILASLDHVPAVRPCLAWSADGERIFTSRRDSTSGHVEIASYPLNGGTPTVLPGRPWQAVLDLRVPADGSALLVLGQPTWIEDLNINVWRLPLAGGEPEAITDDLTFYSQFSVDRSGRRIALDHYAHKRTLRVLDTSDGTQRDLASEKVANGRVAWLSPDRLLVNQLVGSTVGLAGIDLETGAVAGIVAGKAYVAGLAVSRDGRRIAYRTTTGSDHDLWLAAADGSSPRLLTTAEHDEYAPSFTATDDALVFARRDDPGSPYRLWWRALAGGAERRLDDRQASNPLASPDSAFAAVYLWDDAAEEYGLHIVPYDGSEPRPLTLPEGAGMLTWTPGSRGITCAAHDGDEIVVLDVPRDGGPPREVARFAAGGDRLVDASWDPDDRRLALCIQSVAFDITLLER